MKRVLAAVSAPLAMGAAEPQLVPDVSQRDVEIRYSFTGADLLLFGAILYPGGRVPSGRVDVAVVLKGPTQSIVVREKQKLGGVIWANAASARFRSAPGFYAVAASRPLAQIIDRRTAAIYELGLDSIHLSPSSANPPEERLRFQQGLAEQRRSTGLYVAAAEPVTISEGVLYRARLPIPPRAPVGRYLAETYLIRDGKVVAAAERSVELRKQGFERAVAATAAGQPLAYGLAAVALAVLAGWAAGAAFRRM